METMNDFCILGRLDKTFSKTFNFSSKQPDGTTVPKTGIEIYINVCAPTGSEYKILVTMYKKELIEPYLGKYVILKGFFKGQSFPMDNGETNYKTVLVIKEQGGIIPLVFHQNPYAKNQNNETSNSNSKTTNSTTAKTYKSKTSTSKQSAKESIENNEEIWD